MSETKIIGVVSKIIGRRIILKARSAASFDTDTSQASFIRKNGTSIEFGQIQEGDKVEVVGQLWPDNSLSAQVVKDLSLYPHRSSLLGRVESVKPDFQGLVLKTTILGSVEVGVSPLTSVTVNGVSGQIAELKPGIRAKVRGIWERDRRQVLAENLDLKLRKVKIEIVGEIVMKSPESLTVVSTGVIYGVDIRQAKLLNAKRKLITYQDLQMGVPVKVFGKHIPEDPSLEAQVVRETR